MFNLLFYSSTLLLFYSTTSTTSTTSSTLLLFYSTSRAAQAGRRIRNFDDAYRHIRLALDMFPRYTRALEEKAGIEMDSDQFDDAVKVRRTVI